MSFFETGFCDVAQAGLELTILLSQPQGVYYHTLPYLVSLVILTRSVTLGGLGEMEGYKLEAASAYVSSKKFC